MKDLNRIEVIENLESRFSDVFNGSAINLNEATETALKLIEDGVNIERIRVTKLGSRLIVTFGDQ